MPLLVLVEYGHVNNGKILLLEPFILLSFPDKDSVNQMYYNYIRIATNDVLCWDIKSSFLKRYREREKRPTNLPAAI